MPETELLEEVQLEEKIVQGNKLILHNDDVTPFDRVIYALMIYLGKTAEEAYDHALTVHTKGKDVIYTGEIDELRRLQEIFTTEKMTVSIETSE